MDNQACDAYFGHIYDTLVETAVYIEYYKQLFCYNQNRVNVINDSASAFFIMCGTAMLEAIIMRLSRITDAAKMGRNNNLTIRRLVETVLPASLAEYEMIESQIESLEAHLSSVRNRRNKRLGHSDLASFNQDYPITIEQLSEAITKLTSIFNAMIKHLPEGLAFKSDTMYLIEDPILDSRSDARAAVIMMEKGRRYSKLIGDLAEENLLPLIPEAERYFGRAYFKRSVLQYVDERQQR